MNFYRLKLYLFVFLILLSTLSGIAQHRIITIKLLDASNKKPISNAAATIEGVKSSVYSNKAGYFQLKIEGEESQISVSHIGYETSRFQIPKHDVFTILINRDYTKLPDLNLLNYPTDSVEIKNHKAIQISGFGDSLEQNAQYSGGWEKFYFYFGNSITQSKKYSSDIFKGQVQFTISEDSLLTDIMTIPDTILNREVIISTLRSMSKWYPALQNGKTALQNFQLKIYGEVEKYRDVEVQPSPLDGMSGFYRYVGKTMKYPQEARRNRVEGRVFIQFVVDIDGKIFDVKVVKGIGFGCDEEAVLAVASAPIWNPGKQGGKPVRVRVILPITFSMGSSITTNNPYPDESLSEIIVTAIGIEEPRHYKVENTYSRLREKDPEFPGGPEKKTKYFHKNNKLIDELPDPNKFGNRVRLEFTVDVKEKIKDINVINSLGEVFDSEAIRLYNEMPDLIPATKNELPIEKTLQSTVRFGSISQNRMATAYGHFQSGISNYDKGKFEKAIEQFTKAITLNPTALDYYFNRALTLIEISKMSKACEDLKLIKSSDESALILYEKYCN